MFIVKSIRIINMPIIENKTVLLYTLASCVIFGKKNYGDFILFIIINNKHIITII